MKSPFPGMDPYVVSRWGNFHASFMIYLRDAINPSLPASLRAMAEERVLVEAEDPPEKSYYPDAHIFETKDTPRGVVAVVEMTDEPVVLADMAEGMTQRSIVIVDARSGGQVVTAIELLSPFNKRSGARHREYSRKQEDYLEAGVNLLELDLLLEGEPTTIAARVGIPAKHRTPWHASLKNFRRRERVELYPISVRRPLPRLALPLRPEDAPIALALQPVFDLTYDRGYYGQDTRYDPADWPALAHESAWMQEQIADWKTAQPTSPKV